MNIPQKCVRFGLVKLVRSLARKSMSTIDLQLLRPFKMSEAELIISTMRVSSDNDLKPEKCFA